MQRERASSTSSGFRYFLHAWRAEPTTGTDRRAQLVGTDGSRVRAVRGRGAFLTVEQVREPMIARNIVEIIECEWEPEAPFFGHESLADAEKVAILSNGPDADRQWAVFRCPERDFQTGELIDETLAGSEALRRHLIGGARVAWRSGQPRIEAALEVRSWRESGESLGLLEHVEQWELRATTARRGGREEIGLVPEGARSTEPKRRDEGRLEAAFPLDRAMYRNFGDESSFQAWFVVQFDRHLVSVPEIWRRFWMAVEFKRE